MAVKHNKVSTLPDLPDVNNVRPSDWNADHKFSGGTDGNALVRDSTQPDGSNWVNILSLVATRFNQAEPVSPQDGDMWVARSGTSPSRTIALKVRDGGTTHILFEITV